ncbi:UNVERIFIED_CONTAM: Syntaxin-8 [Siphonaria sp. JEL0065]|nr:Syntaxin-8 [Siphonaria sp. JEL0065]
MVNQTIQLSLVVFSLLTTRDKREAERGQVLVLVEEAASQQQDAKAAARAGLDTSDYAAALAATKTRLGARLDALEVLVRKVENDAALKDRVRAWEDELLRLAKQVDRIDQATTTRLDPEQARKELFQSRKLQQQQYQQVSSSSTSRGAAESLSLTIEDDTDHLSTGELMQLQHRMIDDQDAHLDALSNTLLRQKQIGEQIGNELDFHVDLLQQTDQAVERTQTRLGNVNNRVGEVMAGSKTDYRSNLLIVVLVFILVLIVFS